MLLFCNFSHFKTNYQHENLNKKCEHLKNQHECVKCFNEKCVNINIVSFNERRTSDHLSKTHMVNNTDLLILLLI